MCESILDSTDLFPIFIYSWLLQTNFNSCLQKMYFDTFEFCEQAPKLPMSAVNMANIYNEKYLLRYDSLLEKLISRN